MYTRTRYLIQHRESKRYIRRSIDIHDKLELTADAWIAWGMSSVAEAFHTLHENPFMPADKEAYRIVKTEDTREVEESEDVQQKRVNC